MRGVGLLLIVAGAQRAPSGYGWPGLAAAGMKGQPGHMTTIARSCYAGHRFSAEIIRHAVWLYFRFPLGLRLVEELLAARGIVVSHETVR